MKIKEQLQQSMTKYELTYLWKITAQLVQESIFQI